jgi:Ca2+-binding RTX toxin-like protein
MAIKASYSKISHKNSCILILIIVSNSYDIMHIKFILLIITVLPFVFGPFLNLNTLFASGDGDGDGERYRGPITKGDSSERVIYCTTTGVDLKAPLCQGTSKSDIIIGTSEDNFIEGKGADDAIQGQLGNDEILANDGNDDIQGGPGGDNVYGEDGEDLMYGGFDGDFLVGGKGDDELYGGPGEDILEGGPGKNYFDCGEDYDIIIDFKKDQDTASNNCEDIRVGL